MTKDGVAWAAAFNKISFPPRDKNLRFQPQNLLQTLSLTYSNIAFLRRPMIAGTSRYFSASFESGIYTKS